MSMAARKQSARTWRPFAARLADDLAGLLDAMDALLDGSTIHNIDPNRWGYDAAFIGWPSWGWREDGDEQTQRRLDLIAEWERWLQLFDLLFPDPPPDVEARIESGTKLIGAWLRRPPGDHSVPSTMAKAKAKAKLRDDTRGLLELLEMKASAPGAVVAMPDTNAQILSPNVARYGSALGTNTYEVHLVTTVVAELDRLKVEGRTPELRDKVQDVIRRIKGYRDRGSLTTGAPVTHTVRLFAQAREPDFSRMPGWLDRENNDDRILASAMQLQGSRAAATVVLVTGDLNLQTKADSADLPYVEPPI